MSRTTLKDHNRDDLPLGDLAEDAVQHWATSVGITVNPVRRDRLGWDLELAHKGEGNIPGFTCKVQVKGTRSRARHVTQKVSNWERAVRSPLPWFVFVIRFTEDLTVDPQPISLAILHIDFHIVEDCLKTIQQLKGSQLALHTHKKQVSWEESLEVSGSFPVALLERLRAAIGPDMLEYGREKASWVDRAGSAGGGYEGTIRFEAPSTEVLYERLARAALGLDDSLEVAEFTLSKRRFGLLEPVPLPSSGKGILKFEEQAPARDWTLTLDGGGNSPLTIGVALRSTKQVFPQLPEEYYWLRLETPYLELILRLRDRQFTARQHLPAEHELIDVGEFSRALQVVMVLVGKRVDPLECTLVNPDLEVPPFKFTVQPDPKPIPPRALEFSNSVNAIWELARHWNVEQPVKTTMLYVEKHGPTARLMAAALRVERSQKEPLSYFVETTVPGGAKVDWDRAVAFVMKPCIQIGRTKYTQFIALVGRPSIVNRDKTDVRLKLESENIEGIDSFASLDRCGEFEDCEEAIERLEARLGGDHVIMIL